MYSVSFFGGSHREKNERKQKFQYVYCKTQMKMVHKNLRVNFTPNCSLFWQQGSSDAHVEHLYAGRLEFRIQAFRKKTTFVKSSDLCW